MMGIVSKFTIYILIFTSAFLLISCGKKYSPEYDRYIKSIEKERAEKDSIFGQTSDSPFAGDSNAKFHRLVYYDVNPGFVFKSRLTEYRNKDTVKVFGTKGEERKAVKYGYLKFNYSGAYYKLNMYKGFSKNGDEYFSIWFTDNTTGEETYGVGRYLDFELNADPEYEYTIDFNKAYNPYCAYSARYSCAIPTKEDYINMAITAGEKRFH
ncbi:MAG: hypothetical protein AUK34_02890 [Ignavibacteria bacterium CG2_30_36_16]|nr:DUF1684 domain-containing protein [Ignavibacteria bacterium]OIP62666.1 MAG: hypothetical protein AUK34_02890 [Ignavibacteria bacterium CG2_30_36_16]PJB00172.1 MAG: hypothetical protein CO127_09090 [Ignavibacteria bacterium CG_4_9_14_3_um_filter_36_18]